MNVEVDLPKRVLFDWKKLTIYIVPTAFLIGLLIAKIEGRKGSAEEEFVAATRAFSKWEQVLNKGSEQLISLETIIKKHPELHDHYDIRIGQNFLAARFAEEAEPYVQRTLKRAGPSYYSDYSRDSLLIGKGNYSEALKGAYALKERMLADAALQKEGKGSSTLFAFNLVRIGMLCEQSGDQKGELEAWKEIKSYAGWGSEKKSKETGQEGFKKLLSHLSVQETTLLDYINAREGSLGQ